MHHALTIALILVFVLGWVSSLWASAIGDPQLDGAPAVTDRPRINRDVPDIISINPDYDGDPDMELNPGIQLRNPPSIPLPPLPLRQQEALDASRAQIRENYAQGKPDLYDQYQLDIKGQFLEARDNAFYTLPEKYAYGYPNFRISGSYQCPGTLTPHSCSTQKRYVCLITTEL